MKLKRLVSQHRRDTRIILECGQCGHVTPEESGYDDDHFYQKVIPDKECPVCKKKDPPPTNPKTPKYDANQIV